MHKIIRNIGIGILLTIWGGLAVLAWASPAEEVSEAERRPLAQFPQLSSSTLLSGKFMEDFEDYTLDQFPARDSFRQLKALFHYNVLGQLDNNGIYIADGYAAKLEYPLNTDALEHALSRFNWLYEKYLSQSGSRIFCAIVPDKSYYLAAEKGYPTMDYDALFEKVETAMPWAQHIDLTGNLAVEDYYYTDLHWRQEKLLPTAQALCQARGITALDPQDFTETALDRPFYGVYHGQAALPLEAETLYILESDLLDQCSVYNYETGSYAQVYDMEKLTSKDLYDVFLSGPQSLLRIENPDAATEKELLVFRDSFGSSLVPLLVQDYAAVTLVDIRYISSQMLSRHIEFSGQDVLFLYSTLVLNNGTTLK